LSPLAFYLKVPVLVPVSPTLSTDSPVFTRYTVF
jgi:hypothetical protein